MHTRITNNASAGSKQHEFCQPFEAVAEKALLRVGGAVRER